MKEGRHEGRKAWRKEGRKKWRKEGRKGKKHKDRKKRSNSYGADWLNQVIFILQRSFSVGINLVISYCWWQLFHVEEPRSLLALLFSIECVRESQWRAFLYNFCINNNLFDCTTRRPHLISLVLQSNHANINTRQIRDMWHKFRANNMLDLTKTTSRADNWMEAQMIVIQADLILLDTISHIIQPISPPPLLLLFSLCLSTSFSYSPVRSERPRSDFSNNLAVISNKLLYAGMCQLESWEGGGVVYENTGNGRLGRRSWLIQDRNW